MSYANTKWTRTISQLRRLQLRSACRLGSFSKRWLQMVIDTESAWPLFHLIRNWTLNVLLPVHTVNSVRINQHTCGTLIADLVDALSLLASTSQSKDWKSLPRPVVECIKCWEFVSRKNPVLISKNFVRLDQGEGAFPLRKATSRQPACSG